jgi:hypothetical protein
VPNFFIAQIFAEMLLLGSGDPAGSPEPNSSSRSVAAYKISLLTIYMPTLLNLILDIVRIVIREQTECFEIGSTKKSIIGNVYEDIDGKVRGGGVQIIG